MRHERAAAALKVAGVAGGASAAAHLLPGLAGARALRIRVSPGLAGIGDPGHLALTFDDGPDPASTPQVLEVLGALGWRATFFMLGAQVERAPGLAAEVAAAGHELAVHGYSHRNHLLRPWWSVSDDLARARDAVAEAAGAVPAWFRPPYGALAGSSLVGAHRCALRTVLWSAWGRDWRAAADGPSVVADVEAGRGPGATVLLHDSDVTSAPGAWKSTLAALPVLAERWAEAGLTVGPLCEHGM